MDNTGETSTVQSFYHDFCAQRNKQLEINAVPVRYGVCILGMHILLTNDIPKKVVRHYKIYPIPNACRYLSGMINLNGSVVPVFNLHRYFKTEYKVESHYILVLNTGKEQVGFFIDEFPKSVDMSISKPVAISSMDADKTIQPYIKAVLLIGGIDWYELDFDGLLTHLNN